MELITATAEGHATDPKVIITFPDPATALKWFDAVAEAGLLPEGTDLYEPDAADIGKHLVIDRRTFLMRRAGDRPERFALRNVLARKSRRRKRPPADPGPRRLR